MCKVIFFASFLVFHLVLHYGNAVQPCTVPPKTFLLYLDLEQLNSVAVQQRYSSSIHSAMLCEKGSDEECIGQICCHEEVGCCYTDPIKHIRKCGCKKNTDKTCTFTAPYAIMAQSECNANEKTTIAACLREKRENDETTHFVTKNSTLHSGQKPKFLGGLLNAIISG